MKKMLTGCLAVVVLAGCASDPVTVMPDATVVAECTVVEGGALDACVVVQESHPGQGFAEAMLQNMGEARLQPGQGRVGEKVRFTTRFHLADD